jgi:hypothetical protein
MVLSNPKKLPIDYESRRKKNNNINHINNINFNQINNNQICNNLTERKLLNNKEDKKYQKPHLFLDSRSIYIINII